MSSKIVYFIIIASIGLIVNLFSPDFYYSNESELSIKNDSIFNKLKESENINEISSFINLNPDFPNIEELKKRKKILFKNPENLVKSNISIDSILAVNPCYIPLYKKIDRTGRKIFNFKDLFSDSLPLENPYRKRFLVADLNTIDTDGMSRGVKEIFPEIEKSWEFQDLFDFFQEFNIDHNNIKEFSDEHLDSIVSKSPNSRLMIDLIMLRNYFSKVNIYKTKPIIKSRSIIRGKEIATGQNICLCEVVNDTILFVGKFATSARGKTRFEIIDSIEDNPRQWQYLKSMPVGKYKKYYAPLYHITNRHWETQRKYNESDKLRDSVLGGGLKRIVFFDGKSQLPNFLTIEPDKLYPKAVRRNGIHESSLSIVSKCMLGSPQSLGCLRMSDYTSKYLRWWTPRGAKLFVYYDEDKYIDKEVGEIKSQMPFKNEKEGNIFRRWVNKNYPDYASKLDLDEDGACDNCYIYMAWEKYKAEFLLTNEGNRFKNRLSKIEFDKENHL